MRTSKRILSSLTIAALAILFGFSLASPAAAARSRGSHGGRSSKGHGHSSSRSGRHSGSRCDSGLRISIGLTDRVYTTTTRRYVPGYYQTRTEQVLVEAGHYDWQTHYVQVTPGRYEIRSVPAVERIVLDEHGNKHTIVLEPARTETVYIPPRYEQKLVRVWVPDRYETRTTQVWVPGRWVTEPSCSYSYPSSRISIGGTIRF